MRTTRSSWSVPAIAVALISACASNEKSGPTRSNVVDASAAGGSSGATGGGGSAMGGSPGAGGASGGKTGMGGAEAGGNSGNGGTAGGGGSGDANAGGRSGSAGHGGGGTQSGGTAGTGGLGGAGAGGKGGSAGAGDGGIPCGTSTCSAGELCITGRCAGCCNLPPACIPIPSGCSETLGCGCFNADPCGGCTKCQSVTASTIVCGNCQCVCAAAWSPVETPNGSRRIADLHVGDLVYTIDHGERVAMPIARVNRQRVSHHALVRVRLTSGTVVEMSGGHPTGDGGRFDALMPGQRLGAVEILSAETVPYDEPFTYDILPASDTGTYFVGDAWVGSTLYEGHCGQ